MPNTDTKINYYLRQQKSIERKMFCHLFNNVNKVFDLRQYRYIGMGAKYFADFLLFHREFGFQNMISIEADNENTEKYEFNKPLQCIEMKFGFSSDVLPKLDWTSSVRTIIWLDYDECLKKYMLEDLEILLPKLASGSMFFISFNSNWYNHKDKLKQAEVRECYFRRNLDKYCPQDLSPKDFADMNKHLTQCNPINNTIDNSIAAQPGMTYVQLVDFVYQDGCEMTTVGGIILNKEDFEKFDCLDFSHLDFIKKDRGSEEFSLKIPPLTHKEAVRIFEQLPCADLSTIHIPGLQDSDIEQIAKIYRYYPFFLETSLFT